MPPATAAGTAPSPNHLTTERDNSVLLNHTLERLPINWAIVRMGTASCIPKTHTKTGSMIAPPPKPTTAERVEAASAAIPTIKIMRVSGNAIPSGRSAFDQEGPEAQASG